MCQFTDRIRSRLSSIPISSTTMPRPGTSEGTGLSVHQRGDIGKSLGLTCGVRGLNIPQCNSPSTEPLADGEMAC